jgi:hypothetical protein
MNKERKRILKKINILKKQLKKNLSLLNKHIYNYKLEILLSVLVMLIIFLISLIYPNSYIAQEGGDYNNTFSEDISSSDSNDNVKQSLDDYLASVEADRADDSEYYSDEDLRKEVGDNEGDNLSDDINAGNDDLENSDSDSADDISVEADENEEIKEDLSDFSSTFVNSFGDSFSSSAFLNREKTNMYLDDISTALVFDPLYDFSRLGSCGGDQGSCDFEKDIRILDYGMEACIDKTSDCLKVINEGLYYNGREIALPLEIRGEEIISLTLGALDTKFLLGAVLAEEEDEYALVYSFDGSSFTNVINKNSKYHISSKYQRQGGIIGFGGSDDNYLIVYAGYRGQAFQVYNGEIIDISHMFGLRVTNRGFMPQILQSGSGNDSTWYICSLDKSNPKFIKLWQNNTKYIQGSLDLSYDIYSSSDLYDNFDYCYLSESDNTKVYLSFETNSSNSLDIWQFKDNGFDNSHDYSVVSVDILDMAGYVAKNAVVKDIGLSVSEKKYTNNIDDYGTLYLSSNNINHSSGSGSNNDVNDKYNWTSVEVGRSLRFEEPSVDIYWRLDLKSRDNYFSPWLDHINRLNYLLLSE